MFFKHRSEVFNGIGHDGLLELLIGRMASRNQKRKRAYSVEEVEGQA